jgi:hypothetical protein
MVRAASRATAPLTFLPRHERLILAARQWQRVLTPIPIGTEQFAETLEPPEMLRARRRFMAQWSVKTPRCCNLATIAKILVEAAGRARHGTASFENYTAATRISAIDAMDSFSTGT